MAQQAQETIRLVTILDPGYRAWCRSRRERMETGRARDPLAQDYYAELKRWEGVVQQLLAAAISNPVDERILESPTRDRKGKTISIYREIDFVSGRATSPDIFVEIKFREQSMNGKSGWPQLDRSLEIARTRWPGVRGLCVNVALGDVLQTEQECVYPTVMTSELPAAIQDLSLKDGNTVWICGNEVAAFALQHDLFTDDDVRRLPELREVMLNPQVVLQTRNVQSGTTLTGLFDQFRPCNESHRD